jgi:hypothetical protein
MEARLFMEPKSFTGTLSKGDDQIELTFSVQVETSGEAFISFNRFPLDASTKFILDNFNNSGTYFEKFSLSGISGDSTTFTCDDVIFTSLENMHSEAFRSICPVVHYSLAKIILPCEDIIQPVLSWKLKGFQSFRALLAETELGTVEISGAKDSDGKNELSGHIKVVAPSNEKNLLVWRKSANDLCNHLRHVMSFAANADLASPITEFANQGQIEFELFSCGKQRKSVWPPFAWLDLQNIFQCAVRSYFQPVFEVKNLIFAIQWFNMHGTYREANLISAMTVLENLIDSNLSEEDRLLLSHKKYEILRKKLSNVVKEEAKSWAPADPVVQQQFVIELNNRFSDLQRKSLLDKLYLLAGRWGVQLDDIDRQKIGYAKAARDQVVHRGLYMPGNNINGDLHDHVLTVRELVVRFILTALDFEGSYLSYVEGQHSREFRKGTRC